MIKKRVATRMCAPQGQDFTLNYLGACVDALTTQEMNCSSMQLYEVPREVRNAYDCM